MTLSYGTNTGLLIDGDPREQHYTALMQQWRGLDGLIQCCVKDKDLTAPPGTPVNGDMYIVGPAPTGAWAGQSGKLARYFNVGTGAPGWEFYAPKVGWSARVEDEIVSGLPALYSYSGSAWVKSLGTAAGLDSTTSSTDKTASAALKVGDGGLLVPIVLVGPNLNTRRPTGFYYAQAPANNPPGTSSGWLLQQDISDAYNTHFYVDAATGDFHHRTLSNSVQRPWREVWDTGNTSANVQTMLSAANNAAIRSAISASSLPPFTLGTTPSAVANTNLLIVITDLTGGREPCFSNGTNWLRCSDKTVAN